MYGCVFDPMVIVEHLTSPNSPKTAASVKNGSGSRSARNVPHSNNRTNRRTKSPTNKESPSPKQSPSRVKTQKHGSLTRVKSSGKVQTVLRTPSPKETAKTFDTCCLSCAVIFLLVVIIGGSVLFWMRKYHTYMRINVITTVKVSCRTNST